MLDRRSFLAAASAWAVSPVLVRPPHGSDRKFLFVVADGGWDTTKVFTPMFGRSVVEMEAGATQAEARGIPFTDSALRPSVREFFQTHGGRACVVNGIAVPELTHARCRRLLLTGVADAGRDDWSATLRAHARISLLAPYLAPRGTFTDPSVALDGFEAGVARCATVRSGDGEWDSHADIAAQDALYERLFRDLNGILADLASRTGTDGRPLSEQVTVVVMSEMGRAPKLNARGGRDHWRFTSAMLVGAGVRGGQVVGGMDDDFQGRPVDLASGEATDRGTRLTAGHLGATLLALGDVDPASKGLGERPIAAAMS